MTSPAPAEPRPVTTADQIAQIAISEALPASVWALLTLTERGDENNPDMGMGFIVRSGIDVASGLELAVMLLESQGYTVTDPS